MTLAKASWYVGCSPRDPRKLLPELNLLFSYDGMEWTRDQQDRFYKELTKLDSFEGEGYQKEPSFSVRDRVAKMKTYGLVYVDDNNILRVTTAGKRIVNSKIPDEIFLKQMLKWQYPSYQHKGDSYPESKFFIRPFIFVTKLIQKLDGMSKTELAIFAFTETNESNVDSVVEEIKQFRVKRNGITGKVPKKQFDFDVWYKRFNEAYSGFVAENKTHIRESKKSSGAEAFIKTKMRNSGDMADALFRHLRFTPLFTIRGNRIIISENMKDIVTAIITAPIELNKDYNSVKTFYAYMGNPELPKTVLDEKVSLVENITRFYDIVEHLYKNAIMLDSKLGVVKLPDLKGKTILELKELLFDLISLKKKYELVLLEKSLQTKDKGKEIMQMFEKIVDRDVIDAPTYFEWNTWRTFLYLDDEIEIKPNFTLDSDLQPLSTAGGKKGDIEAYYSEFNVVIEVTLTSGERQSNTEIEPVWRHVGNFQKEHPKKKTFGLFIAPKIDNATPRHFFIYTTQPVFDDGAKVTIIPLSLGQLLEIINFSLSIPKMKASYIKNLFEAIESDASRYTDGVSWYKTFPEIIAKWKSGIK